MAGKKKKIDLLVKKRLSQKGLGQLLLWALTVGRYIVIFTELIVILGVVARFTLDVQRNSISENIADQQAILSNYLSTEKKFRRLQQQLKTVSSLEQEGVVGSDILRKLSEIMPVDMRINSVAIDLKSISLNGIALSPQGFSTFLSGLQSDPQNINVILESISSGGSQDPTLQFSLKVELVGSSQKPQPVQQIEEEVIL